jgi:hypothetical protein
MLIASAIAFQQFCFQEDSELHTDCSSSDTQNSTSFKFAMTDCCVILYLSFAVEGELRNPDA